MFTNKKRILVRGSKSQQRVVSSFSLNPFMTGGVAQGQTLSVMGGTSRQNQLDLYLTGIISEDDTTLLRMFEDIYNYDVNCGATVDLMSALPFSDFGLIGVPKDQAQVYESNVERLNIKSLLPQISVDFLSYGAFTSTLVYNNDQKMFTDLIPYNPRYLELQNTPLFSADPLIKVKPSPETKNFLTSQEPYFKELRNRLSPDMLKSMGNKVTLDPLTTLYIPRMTHAAGTGTSIFKRVVPIYLLEKILYRGTLTEANRRQRSTMHVTMGEEGVWEPTEAEMQDMVNLFQQAELDPMGAIVATRNSVQTSDIRQSGDFWKYTDIIDVTGPLKLRALGVSEVFLSGEANYSTMEVSLSVFMDGLRSYREFVTRKLLTNKLFPLIASINGFFKEETASTQRENLQYTINDSSKLSTPEVVWHKSLRPEADRDYMEILSTLEEKGVPVGLRAWSAAAGQNLDSLMEDLKEDLQLKEDMKKLKAVVEAENNEENSEGNSDDVDDFQFGVAQELASLKHTPLLARDFGDNEIIGISKTGKKKMIHNQKKLNEDYNRKISKALKSISDEATLRSNLNKAGIKTPYNN